jgi:predicted nucleic acid-binding protein
VTAVSNASPLIALARIGHLDLLPEVFERVLISTGVYNQVVIAGARMPGAKQVSEADWIWLLNSQTDSNSMMRTC